MKILSTRKCVVFISAIIMQFVSLSLVSGFSVMYAEIISVFNETRFVASLLQGLYLVMLLTGGILWSGIIQRFGTAPTTAVGLLLAATGLFLSSFAKNIGMVIALAGVLNGFGMSVCFLLSFISVNETFREYPRYFLTGLTIGASLGHMLGPLIFEIMIENYFWDGTFLILAGLVLQGLPFGLLMCFCSRRADDGYTEEMARPAIFDFKILKDIYFCTLLMNIHLIHLTGTTETFFIVDQLVAFNIPRAKGSVLASVLGVASLCGRIIACLLIYLCKRVPTIFHWLYVCIIMAVSHLLVLKFQALYNLLVPACALQGLCFGTLLSQWPTVVFEAVGAEKYPAAMVLANVVNGLGDLLSCIVGGLIRDGLGTYDMVYYVAAGASLYIAIASVPIGYKIRQNNKRRDIELISGISSKTGYTTLK